MGLLSQIYGLRWELALATLAIFIGLKIHSYNRLSAFKGPFASGFSNIWHTRALLSPISHLKYREVCDKYGKASQTAALAMRPAEKPRYIGPIARIGPNDLITSSPDLLTHMSAVRSPYTRGAWYNRGARHRPGRDNLFSEIDEEVHTRRRNQMAPGVR